MTADPPPPAPATGADDLQFDRAESAAPPHAAQTAGAAAAAATTCAVCHQSISDSYFEANGKIICPRCREMIIESISRGSAAGRFFRAVLFGAAAAVAGAALWYGVARLWHVQSAFVAIVIGIMVGMAVRGGSHRRGGIGYQLVAVVLTYLAIGAGIVLPEVQKSEAEHHLPLAGAIITTAIVAVIAPVLAAIDNLISALIIAFGLWEAWRINRHRPLVFNGPYRLAPGVPPPMPAAATVPAP